jgi:hypothetical protein
MDGEAPQGTGRGQLARRWGTFRVIRSSGAWLILPLLIAAALRSRASSCPRVGRHLSHEIPFPGAWAFGTKRGRCTEDDAEGRERQVP